MTSKRIWLPGLWIVVAMAVPAWGLDDRDGSALKKGIPGLNATGQPGAAAPGGLSEADCRAYAQSIVKAVTAGDLAGLNALVDWDSIFATMSRGWDISDQMRQGIFTGLRKSMLQESGIAGQLIQNSKRGGSLRFLRARQSHGRQVVLLRMIQPAEQGGVAYYEFAPQRFPGGKIRATDFYVYTTGEFISETLRRALLPMIASESQSFLAKLIAGEKDYVHDIPEVGRAANLMNEGKAAEALAIYKGLRPETRKQKIVLLGRLRAAQSVDEKEYAAVLAELQNMFPNDPCLELISIDAYVMRKDYDGAIKAIERLDRSVGGDAYLDQLSGSLCELQGDHKGAERFARKAIKEEPTLLSPYWSLVAYSLNDKNYDETLARLKAIDQNFQMTFNDMTKLPQYAGFVKSPQYAQWLDYLKKKPTRKTSATKKSAGAQGQGQVKPGSP